MFALVKVVHGQRRRTGARIPFSLDWFNPFGLDFASVLAPGAAAAVFIYWGWDTAVSVNEETAGPGEDARAAPRVISTVLLLVTYALVSIATVAFAGVGDKGIGLGNPDNSDDVFAAHRSRSCSAAASIGHVLLILLAISILTSASASTQTTILPTARTALSMAVYKAIPEKFARIHPKYLTPTWSTIGMGVVSAALLPARSRWISVRSC